MISVEVDPHYGILTFHLDAALASANLRALSERTGPEVNAAGVLRGMVIQVSQFPPWRDFVQFLDHLRFVQDQRDNFQRIAVVTESSPVEFAARLAAYFPSASIDRFAAHSIERAHVWVAHISDDADTGSEAAQVSDVSVVPEAPAEVVLESVESEAGEEDDWFV